MCNQANTERTTNQTMVTYFSAEVIGEFRIKREARRAVILEQKMAELLQERRNPAQQMTALFTCARRREGREEKRRLLVSQIRTELLSGSPCSFLNHGSEG